MARSVNRFVWRRDMTLTLYGSPYSPYTRAAQIAFLEKGVEFTFTEIGPPDLQTPEHAGRHPFRKMPALEIDGEPLFETGAILRYIDEAHRGHARLQPSDPRARARMTQWVHAAGAYLYPAAFSGVVVQRFFYPKFGMPTDEDIVAASLSATRAHLATLSAALEGGALAGNRKLTLADILAGAILSPLQALEEGQALLAAAPRVRSWIGHLEERPSFQKTAVG